MCRWPQSSAMFKRLLAGPLWFLATLTAYSLVAAMLGAPAQVGPIIAFVVAALVVLDPGDLIWPPVERPSVTPASIGAVLASPAKLAD